MNLTPKQMKILANLAMGGRKNYRVSTPERMGTYPKVGQQVRQRLKNKLNTKTPGGDVDPETGDLIPEGVQKAGHPEAFELGLDKETTSNAEYQKILRRKRLERASMMSDPTHPHHETDDVSQDDVEAADRAARRRKRIGEAMEKQGMLFKTEPEQKTTTVVPAVVGKDRKRGTDKRSRENKKKFNPKNVGKEAY